MIITRTPFRVSFAGGGTDLASFYTNRFGAVLSATLNHHMYVTIHSRFENNFRVSYSRTDISDYSDRWFGDGLSLPRFYHPQVNRQFV